MLRIYEMHYSFVGSRPGRAIDIFEVRVFADLWKAYNGLGGVGSFRNMAFAEIMSGMGDVTDRDAFVATTIIEWLGDKDGSIFLQEAGFLERKYSGIGLNSLRTRAYLARWNEKIVKHPLPANNSGFSGLELILNSRTKPLPYPVAKPDDHRFVDELSERDQQVAERTIIWLASDRGQAFITEAERRIEIQKRRDLNLFHAIWNGPADGSLEQRMCGTLPS